MEFAIDKMTPKKPKNFGDAGYYEIHVLYEWYE